MGDAVNDLRTNSIRGQGGEAIAPSDMNIYGFLVRISVLEAPLQRLSKVLFLELGRSLSGG